jgi:hypothetical protein
MVYPDLPSFRAIYSNYVKIQLEDNNEIVLFLPYYDTPDMARLVLSGKSFHDGNIRRGQVGYSGINTEKYEKEGSLIIRDSLSARIDSDEDHEYNHFATDARKGMELMFFCVF